MASPFQGSADLTKWREEHKKSQGFVAGELGLRQNAVSEWESGNRRPDLVNAFRLETLTGVPVEAWGYRRDDIDAVILAVRARDAGVPAELVVDHGPEYAQEQPAAEVR